MAHGYLGDGYGKNGMRDPDRGPDDDRRGDWRGEQHGGEPRGEWRDRDRDRDRARDEGDRSRFMFEGRDRDRDRERSDHRDSDRGFFSRTADEARDWFREDEHDYRPSSQHREDRSRWSGDERHSRQQPSGQRVSSHQDDHYLDWRQQQMDALDRDYQDYCRERQQQFHQDFDSWRRNRQSGSGGSQWSPKQMEELELDERMDGSGRDDTDASNAPRGTVDPVATATLGTNNSENSTVGRD